MVTAKTGILGGTFDPVHNGHISVGREVKERLGLGRVLFIPAGQPWTKAGRAITAAQHRVAMVRLAISGEPSFELSTAEVERKGPTYTLDTINALHRQMGSADRLYLVLGWDALMQLPLWREPSRVIEMCTIVSVPRPGFPPPDMKTLEAAIPGVSKKLVALDGPEIDISASEIRQRVAAGLPIRGLVPDAVEQYIREHRLYLSEAGEVKILDDLLSGLDMDAAISDVRIGLLQTAVVTCHCGLAATLHGGLDCEGEAAARPTGPLAGKKAQELAEMAYSADLLQASVGMAAINSLLDIDERSCTRANGRDILIQRGKGKKVAIVGHFPFVERLRQTVGELWVMERRPREGDVVASESENLIPRADVVGITGTAFTNHSIEGLLALCKPDAYVLVLGPTAPLSPVLFRHGVSAVSGSRVCDVQAVLRAVSEGAAFRQMTGVELLTMEREG